MFQLRLNKFTTGITDQQCCDSHNAVTTNGLRRTNNGCDCDIKFHVCFRNYMQNIGGNSEEECTFGKAETAVISGRGGDLSARLQPITFDINFKWPVSYLVLFKPYLKHCLMLENFLLMIYLKLFYYSFPFYSKQNIFDTIFPS